MKKFLIATAVAASFVLVACGGSSDPCSGGPASKCSADPAPTKPTDAEIKACQEARKTAKCVTEGDALGNCIIANQKCGSDNKTDITATLAACSSQTEAYTKCFTASLDAGQ